MYRPSPSYTHPYTSGKQAGVPGLAYPSVQKQALAGQRPGPSQPLGRPTSSLQPHSFSDGWSCSEQPSVVAFLPPTSVLRAPRLGECKFPSGASSSLGSKTYRRVHKLSQQSRIRIRAPVRWPAALLLVACLTHAAGAHLCNAGCRTRAGRWLKQVGDLQAVLLVNPMGRSIAPRTIRASRLCRCRDSASLCDTTEWTCEQGQRKKHRLGQQDRGRSRPAGCAHTRARSHNTEPGTRHQKQHQGSTAHHPSPTPHAPT